MEVTKIKKNGCEIFVMFTGEQYIFHNNFYGIVAIGTRRGYKNDAERNTFTIEYGNVHTVGGSLGGRVCLEMAKAFIKKSESKYVKVDTTFEEKNVDITRDYYITCKTNKR